MSVKLTSTSPYQRYLMHDKFEAIIKSIVNKFTKANRLIDKEDLIQEGWLALLKAGQSFDPERGEASFITFAYKSIYFSLVNYLKKNRYQMPLLPGGMDFAVSDETLRIADIEHDLKIIMKKLNKRDQEMLKKYFGENQTYRQIATEQKMSYQNAYERINKAMDKVRNK